MESTKSAAVLAKSLEYKNDVPKLVKYIKENRKYFPFVGDSELNELIRSGDQPKK